MNRRFPSIPERREMFRACDISPVRKGCELFAPAQTRSWCQGWGRGTLAGMGCSWSPPGIHSCPSRLQEGELALCRRGSAGVGVLSEGAGPKIAKGKRKVQEWFHIKQAVGHGRVLSVPSFQHCRGTGSGSSDPGPGAGAAGLEGAVPGSLSPLGSTRTSGKRGGSRRAELRVRSSGRLLAKCFFLESLGLGVGEK